MSFHKSGRNDKETPGGSVSPIQETTLGEYINRKLRNEAFDIVQKEKSKLSFADWYVWNKHKIRFNYEEAQLIWKAAQENK